MLENHCFSVSDHRWSLPSKLQHQMRGAGSSAAAVATADVPMTTRPGIMPRQTSPQVFAQHIDKLFVNYKFIINY